MASEVKLLAAKATDEIASQIVDMHSETGSASAQPLTSAQQISGENNRLKRAVDKFLTPLRAA